jgi:hypothetical protein
VNRIDHVPPGHDLDARIARANHRLDRLDVVHVKFGRRKRGVQAPLVLVENGYRVVPDVDFFGRDQRNGAVDRVSDHFGARLGGGLPATGTAEGVPFGDVEYDMTVEIGQPTPTEEKRRLYQRYLDERHDGQMDGSAEEFHRFLYTSPLQTLEFTYRVGGRLVAVGIADVEPMAMSAVYCYFDTEAAVRSPGVFNVLRLIEECRSRELRHLYLGFYVRGCARMSYKASYRPCELLVDGQWLRRDPSGQSRG